MYVFICCENTHTCASYIAISTFSFICKAFILPFVYLYIMFICFQTSEIITLLQSLQTTKSTNIDVAEFRSDRFIAIPFNISFVRQSIMRILNYCTSVVFSMPVRLKEVPCVYGHLLLITGQ